MLEGRVALVTGGSSGIGEATVRLFRQAGADVLVADLRTGVDVSSEESVARLFEPIGSLDILVNCAAWMHPNMSRPFLEQPLDEFDRTMNVNFRGAVLCCRYALPKLLKTCGNIVNVTSVGASVAFADYTAYCSSKAALEHFTRALALDFAPHVRVNAVAPGWIATQGNEFARRNDAEVQKVLDDKVPMRRLGTPEEIARCIRFLASDDASYVTGAVLLADGGWSLP